MIHSKELSNQNLLAINKAVNELKFVDASYKNDIVDFIQAEYRERTIRVGLPNVATPQEAENEEDTYWFTAYHRLNDNDTPQYFVNSKGDTALSFDELIESLNKYVVVDPTFDYIEYEGIPYLIREIEDTSSYGSFLTIATDELLSAITSREDGIHKNARDIDNSIFYYATPLEMQMSDKELLDHILKEQ